MSFPWLYKHKVSHYTFCVSCGNEKHTQARLATGGTWQANRRWMRWHICLLFVLLLCMSACSSRVSTEDIRSGLRHNDLQGLIKKMQETHAVHNEFVTALNLARAYQLQGRWRDSIAAYEMGSDILEEYENRARISMRNLLGGVGSILISRGSVGYFGAGYERVLLHTFNSLNYLMLGDFTRAAVEMRRMEERQEVWLREQEYRLREYLEKRQAVASYGDDYLPSNYSMTEILQSPEVRTLASAYQDPFSYSLSAIVCSIADDANYAEVSMRRAVSLNPGAGEMLKAAWDSKKTAKLYPPSKQDVVVLVFSGLAPALRMEQIRLPAPYIGYIMIDLPACIPGVKPMEPKIRLGREELRPYPLLRIELLAYRALKDEVRYEIGSAIARALARAAISGAVYAGMRSSEQTEAYAGLASLLITGFMDMFSTTTSKSVRNWELLPSAGYIAMGQVERGGEATVRLGGQEHNINMPSDARGVLIMVSQTTTSNVRVDYVAY